MFKKKLSSFVLIISFINLFLYHYPFYKFISEKKDIFSFSGILLIISITILAVFLNALVFYIGFYLLRKVIGKIIIIFFFIANAIAVYFVNTYSVIIDRTMMGNVINTNTEESTAFFSFSFILYLIFLGILPSIYVFKIEIIYDKLKTFVVRFLLTLVFLLLLVYANATNWLWIDKNSTKLGALAMPWSYVVNTIRFYSHQNKINKKQILLPNATINNKEKSVMVLVLGESARSENFSLYGYAKNTNPLLSKINGIRHYKTESCATYTTAGLKCILGHEKTSKLYEILPNYLFRNDVDVYWRTTNWGEPTVKVKSYQKRKNLKDIAKEEDYSYDGVLLSGLKNQILASKKDKILIILHTSTSHGPTYYKKYPKRFEIFKPVCKSVELSKCTQKELINAYDNTIVYTDYLLATIINELKTLEDYKTAMIYISDHGESLGEKNLYMHGVPMSFAPKEQYEIPFIVWTSDKTKKTKEIEKASQYYVFHSVLGFLSVESPIYKEKFNVFELK